MVETVNNATGSDTAGSDRAQSVSANNSTRELDHLTVALTVNDLIFYRDVLPVDGASISEIAAAIKEDEDFLNPLVARGCIRVQRGRKMVVLARYCIGWYDGWIQADIVEITAHYGDETTRDIPLD
ncbi:MAG TPA: hypothetical protein VHP11_10020 [Tepidisphaeraceae bacterium]|nr:hypothetical protein [Tepidisphaeraceae bacterium]